MKKSVPIQIHISVARQQLKVRRGRATERTFPISTSKFGLGSEEGSFKTPVGRFRVAEKIGHGLSAGTAFKSRRPVRTTRKDLQSADLVMSRILWLDGLEAHNANTRDRFIYIHGTNQEEAIGEAASHGCIRMKQADMCELFDLVEVGTPVVIAPPAAARAGREKVRKALRPSSGMPK